MGEISTFGSALEQAGFGSSLESAFFGTNTAQAGSVISHGIIKGYTEVVISNEIIKHTRGK